MEIRKVTYRTITILTVLLYLAIILASVKFQIIDGSRYYRLSETNRIKAVEIKPPRGNILDRQGRIIATVRPAYEVMVLPAVIDSATIAKLSSILKIEPQSIKRKLEKTKNPYQLINIAHDISFVVLSSLEEQLYDLNGVEVTTEPLRYYPLKDIFFHAIGFVGEAPETKIAEAGYSPGDFIGKMGLELTAEDLLKGNKGSEYIEINALGKELGPVTEKRPVEPTPGKEIRTTLDAVLQESTALYLGRYERASVVGIDLTTGGVIILYSKPGIDPNRIVHGMSKATWDSIIKMESSPLYNRATMSRYPPGSTFKILTTIAALNQGWDTSRMIICKGRYFYGNRTFKDWRRHGRVTLGKAIEKSCDVYYYTIGKELGLDPILEVTQLFKLHEKTGIEIEEETSFFPDSGWYEHRYGENWPRGVILNLSIGQGEVLLTPIKLATIYAEIISGKRIHPHLLPTEAVVESLPIESWILDFVHHGLIRVVEEGTGRIISYYLEDAAGKTGTAQNPHGEDHSIFVGYTPIDNPQFLVCVIVENAGHGASVAAPVAGKIMALYKRLYGQKG